MNLAPLLLLTLPLALPGRAAAAGAQEEALGLQAAFVQAAQTARPWVVSITAGRAGLPPNEALYPDPGDFFEQSFYQQAPKAAPGKPGGARNVPLAGSGVVVSTGGYILTNEHVVRGTDEVTVTFAAQPGNKIAGLVIKRDAAADLAVIKIEVPGALPCARLGDSSALRAGEWALAIGSPSGLAQAVTAGIISAPSQKIPAGKGAYLDVIQTDAAINPGNSGGPLLNIRGEVTGINTAAYTPNGEFAGIGFAIPINRAKELLSGLIEN
jgi:serine protease Do